VRNVKAATIRPISIITPLNGRKVTGKSGKFFMSKLKGKRITSKITTKARINNHGCKCTNCCNDLPVSEEEAAFMNERYPFPDNRNPG
jgi:hypothetical protein